MQDKQIRITINKAIDASIELRSKKELINNFIDTVTINTNVDSDWQAFATKHKKQELNQIIQQENLKPEKTQNFIKHAFKNCELPTTGAEFAEILPPTSMFAKDNGLAKTKAGVLAKLRRFFDKYLGI